MWERASDEQILNELRKIFTEFYYTLIGDVHSSNFITSMDILKSLIEKQSTVLFTSLKYLENGNEEEVKAIFQKVARRHKELGISYKSMFTGIKVYINLLENSKLGLKHYQLEKLKGILEETTAEEYIKGILKDSIEFLYNERKFRNATEYDHFVYDKITKHLEGIYNFLENKNHTDYQSLSQSHTNCEVGRFLNGLPFDVMSFNNKYLGLHIKTIHKDIHTSTNDLISYIKNKKFEEAVAIAVRITEDVITFLYNYGKLSLLWQENKDEVLAEYSRSMYGKNNLFILILSCEKDANVSKTVQANIKEILSKYLTKFDFIFYYENDYGKDIKILMSKNTSDFELSLNNLISDFEMLAEKIKDEYIPLVKSPVVSVAKLDLGRIYKLSLDEMAELFKVIRKDLSSIKSENLILIKDYSDELNALLNVVQENIYIRKVALEKLENDDVDIFVHYIFTLEEEKYAVEILGRIRNGDGYIPASKFLPLLVRENLTSKLDYIVLGKVLNSLNMLKKITNRIFINIYPSSFMSDEVIERLRILIDECDRQNINLVVELTEYAVVSNKDILKDLESKKFSIAFDDFGTGYTNYETVGELASNKNARIIKIDGSIVKSVPHSRIYRSIIESVTLFSNSIGMDTVYEFVETKEIIEQIKDLSNRLNIDKNRLFLQGYYLHKPTLLIEECKKVV